MKCLVIDGCLNGTGVRDKYPGGYIEPQALHLSSDLCCRISKWLDCYWNEFYNQYADKKEVGRLVREGLLLAGQILKQLPEDYDIEYFSDALMHTIN